MSGNVWEWVNGESDPARRLVQRCVRARRLCVQFQERSRRWLGNLVFRLLFPRFSHVSVLFFTLGSEALTL